MLFKSLDHTPLRHQALTGPDELRSFSSWFSSESPAAQRLIGGLPGAGSVHGDAGSSDTSPLPGPGEGPWEIDNRRLGGLGAATPVFLVRSDGIPYVLPTNIESPSAHGAIA